MPSDTSAVPDPGTHEAIAKGCTCPVIDNHYGRGFRGEPGVFMYSGGCPVHNPQPPTDAAVRTR
jgi:hypothetical protein